MLEKETGFPILEPDLQISFYFRLQTLRKLYFHDALSKTIKNIEIRKLDEQLSEYVNPDQLKYIASFGLRGETLFPVPYLIETNPFLLGYYRLLYGLSQKEFYNKGPFGRFKNLEEKGIISDSHKTMVPDLCRSLVETAWILINNIEYFSLSIIKGLQLLTLGPQLRGGANTRIGQDATKEIYDLLKDMISKYIKDATDRTIHLMNDSKRNVFIEFFSDPDIRITSKLKSGVRPLVSIEIKGGRDASNIHNRIGEAEKSHQKAKSQGFFEFWTIIRVDVDPEIIKRESPTTTHFFHIDLIKDFSSKEHGQFKDLLSSLIGIRI